MRKIKDQTGGQTYDRQAWFQFIYDCHMVGEKSVHTIREDKIHGRLRPRSAAVVRM